MRGAEELSVTSDADGQDDYLWECAAANNIDAIRELADKALADRRAGRTKKIILTGLLPVSAK